MKAGILVLLLCSIFQNMPLSQDTAIVKFLPLKTGNIWIYNWISNTWPYNGSVRLKITGTTFSNGHIYYNFEQTGNPCTCAQTSYSPLLTQLRSPIKIDSIRGNIFNKSTEWDASDCPSGVYFYELITDDFVDIKKIVLLK